MSSAVRMSGRIGLYLFGNNERRSISGAREHLIRLGIAFESERFWIEVQGPAETVRNIRQVNQNHRRHPLFQGSVQIGLLAAPHRLNEVGPVVATARRS